MAKIAPPPTNEKIIEVGEKGETEGFGTVSWLLFFNQLWTGDTGTNWTPTFTSLTTVGTPTISGVYYRIGQICYFRVDIVPGTSTTSTAGTTFINNFPLTARGNGIVLAVTGNVGSGLGMINASDNRIYPSAWSAITNPVTLIGMVEAS